MSINLVVLASLAAIAQAPALEDIDPCNPPPNVVVKDAVCSPKDAADLVFHVASALAAHDKQCFIAVDPVLRRRWSGSLELWLRRNMTYLAAATRVMTDGREHTFLLSLPELSQYQVGVTPTVRSCSALQQQMDRGDIDLEVMPRTRAALVLLDTASNQPLHPDALTRAGERQR